MQNIKLKFFIVFILFLLQTSVFCQKDVVKAIDEHKAATINALRGSDPNSIVSMLNKIFVMERSGDTSGRQQGIIDKKIDMYVKNFYYLYATDQDFINNKMKKNGDTPKIDNNVTDLLSIKTKAKEGTEKLLKQEIYYSTQRSIEDKLRDSAALITMKAESGANNIDPETVIDGKMTLRKMAEGGSPYGSLDEANKQADPSVRDMLSVVSLIGPDGYSVKDKQAEDAKLYINQLIQASPPPKNFYIPKPDRGTEVSVYLPYADKVKNTPYTKIQISTQRKNDKSEYLSMLNTLNKSSLYREYKMKVRSKLALRTLYFDSIFRIFQERYKATDKDKSLIEKEKDMAQVGLTQEYYNNLKNKSVADVNLETLYTLNKIVYFLHKLHQDNERAQLITAVNGIQVQPLDVQDEAIYIKPVGSLVENKCWDLSLDEVPSGKTKEERRTICPK